MIEADLLIRRIGRLATLAGTAPRTGSAMRNLGIASALFVVSLIDSDFGDLRC